MSLDDKRAQISAMFYLSIDDADIDDCLGVSSISVSGNWIDFNISKCELKETRSAPGELVQQELSSTCTDSSEANESFIREQCDGYGLLRIDYSNGERKVVGTDKNPVQLSIERSGSPVAITLSLKHSSAEFSKFLKSF